MAQVPPLDVEVRLWDVNGRSLNFHTLEIRSLRKRLRTLEVTLAATLAYLVIDLAIRMIGKVVLP